jgi:linoleoyl-CoA desaturase
MEDRQSMTRPESADSVMMKLGQSGEAAHSPPSKALAKATADMWHIHGKVFDLEPFLGHHPGGAQVLRSVRGSDDLTAIFESSHAFSDRSRIERTMQKYYICDCEPTKLKFPDGGFYRVVTCRVRAALQESGVHATRWWCLKAVLLTFAWCASFCLAFFAGLDSLAVRFLAAMVSGHLFINVGFVVMHDASHSAISSRPAVNGWLSWLWNACACWDHRLWHKHHVFRHHSFTGDVDKDPDTVHFTPFLRKHATSGRRPIALSRAMPWSAAVLFVNAIPGMFVGQAISYARWWQRGRLWRMPVVRGASVDLLACAVRLAFIIVYACNPLIAFAYLLANNCTYAVCILPDHDTEETRHASSFASADWGEEQVRNSANFATGNPLVCTLYGGINFQIEHHLFPTLCHVHYATIKPIVRAACHEFGIPYVDHPTVLSAYKSALSVIAKATVA